MRSRGAFLVLYKQTKLKPIIMICNGQIESGNAELCLRLSEYGKREPFCCINILSIVYCAVSFTRRTTYVQYFYMTGIFCN